MTKSKIILAMVVIGVTIASIYFLRDADRVPSDAGKMRQVAVTTGSIQNIVTAQGKLEPKDYVDVGLQVSGQIKKLHVDVSDTVKQGQLLVEIDPRIYQAKVEQDEAQFKSLQAQTNEQDAILDLAQRQNVRNIEQYKHQTISKDAFEQSEATLKEAQAKLASLKAQTDQAQSQLNSDKTNLGFTTIYAPMDGVVASMPVREGQTLNSVQSAPTLMTLANLDIMTVRAQVAEADIPRIRIGMPVTFTTLGDMEKHWQGTVRLVQPSPEIINDVVLYNVLIDAENKDHALMNGMSTQIFFEQAKADNVPVLPMEALGKRLKDQDKDGAKAYQILLKKAGEKPTPTTILVGLTDRFQAEVKSGLSVGDVVVIPGRVSSTDAAKGRTGMPPGMGGPRL